MMRDDIHDDPLGTPEKIRALCEIYPEPPKGRALFGVVPKDGLLPFAVDEAIEWLQRIRSSVSLDVIDRALIVPELVIDDEGRKRVRITLLLEGDGPA